MSSPAVRFHLADLDLAQRCIEGEEEAHALLRKRYSHMLLMYLIRCGATETDAEEVISNLWIDCLAVRNGGNPSQLTKYRGDAKLESWLCANVTNAWLCLKRTQSNRERILSELQEDSHIVVSPAGSPTPSHDPALIALLRSAILDALSGRSAEEIVLLQLHHCYGLHISRLAKIWHADRSQINRQLVAAQRELAMEILKNIKRSDPHLELRWEDVINLCRCADLDLFESISAKTTSSCDKRN